MNKPVISIVTGTRNRPNDLRRLIDSIEDGTSIPWELVISDASDTPIDQLEIATAKAWKHIRVIREYPRLGCTRGYNVAFRAALGEYVLWTNDDTILEPYCAAFAVQFMREHPEIGMGAIAYAEPMRSRYHVNSYFDMIYANFGILNRDFGNEIGWFDEDFPMYGNDNSLAFRVLLADKGIAEVPHARIYHFATWDEHRKENNNQEQRVREVKQLIDKYGPHMTQMSATYHKYGGLPAVHDQTPQWLRERVQS